MKHVILAFLLSVGVLAEAQTNRRDRELIFGGREREERLEVGAKVYNRNGQAGVVKGVFLDGDISAEFFYVVKTYKRSELATEGCRRVLGASLCNGEQVYTSQGQAATVRAFFTSGEIMVESNYTNRTVTAGELAYRGCYLGVCSDDQVVTRNGQSGTLRAFFDNGDVLVEIFYTLKRMSLDDISISGGGDVGGGIGRPGQGVGVQVGAKVYTRNGQSGVVKGVFMNGDVSIEVNYSTRTVSRDELAFEGCARRLLCSGDTVITREGQTGVVKAVFLNGREVIVEIFYVNKVQSIADLALTRSR